MAHQCYVTISDEAVRLHRLAAREYKTDLRRHLELCLEADARAYAQELALPMGEALVLVRKAAASVTKPVTKRGRK